MSLVITIKGKVTEQVYEREILPQFEHARKILHAGQIVVVDLSGLSFVGPSFPAVMLIMMGDLAENVGAKVLLVPPESQYTSAYLERLDFFTYAGFVADFDTAFMLNISKYKENKNSRTILKINRICEESGARSIVNNLLIHGYDIISSNLHYNPVEIDQFLQIVAELCLNITDHSESWGVVLIQYLSYLARPIVRISVVDKGIGIKSSLFKKYAEYGNKSDCDCIKAVLREGITRKSGHPLGLFAIRCFVSRWHGVMKIRSGTGKVWITENNKEKQVSRLIMFPGTHADIQLPLQN